MVTTLDIEVIRNILKVILMCFYVQCFGRMELTTTSTYITITGNLVLE